MTGQLAYPFALPPLGRVSRAKSIRAYAPRVSHAAVRVPDPRHLPLEIQFPAGRREDARKLNDFAMFRASP